MAPGPLVTAGQLAAELAGVVTRVDLPASDGGLPAVEVDWDGLGPREHRRSYLKRPTP